MKVFNQFHFRRIAILFGFLSLLFVLLILTLRYSDSGQQFAIKAHQYIEQNKPQNTGLHRYLLHTIELVLSAVPSPSLIEYDTQYLDVGFSPSRLVDESDMSFARQFTVGDEQQLSKAMKRATAGDIVKILPGEYKIDKRLTLGNSGIQNNPIRVIASTAGRVVFNVSTTEGIYINKAFWHFEGIKFQGVCIEHRRCEHAVHLYGDADHVSIINNQFINFNAAIKSNGNYQSTPAKFPDYVTVSYNDIYNTSVRQTRSPSSPVDIVGGNNWRIENNFIADFARKVVRRTSVTYGAFLKGGGTDGVFKSNLVNCSWKLPYQSHLDVRVGLSLGNGGTESAYCQSNQCEFEHNNGKIIDNVVLNCLNDVSIYLNKAAATQIQGNTLLNSLGIDARFKQTSVSILNNTIQGRVLARDGAFISERDNVMVVN